MGEVKAASAEHAVSVGHVLQRMALWATHQALVIAPDGSDRVHPALTCGPIGETSGYSCLLLRAVRVGGPSGSRRGLGGEGTEIVAMAHDEAGLVAR